MNLVPWYTFIKETDGIVYFCANVSENLHRTGLGKTDDNGENIRSKPCTLPAREVEFFQRMS